MGTPDLEAILRSYNEAGVVLEKEGAPVEEVMGARNTLLNASSEATESVKAYARLAELLEEAEEVMETCSDSDLSDYYMEAYDDYEASSLGLQECLETVAKMEELILFARNNSIQVGDITHLIVNPGFDDGKNGWTGADAGAVSWSEIEIFSNTFNMYQSLEGVANGLYLVKCQGFFRTKSNEDAYSDYEQGIDEVRCMLYANDKESKMMNVMSEGLNVPIVASNDYCKPMGGYVPNGMEGARGYLDAGLYNNEVMVVVTDRTLTFGIKLESSSGYYNYWMLADNFQLEYLGSDESVLTDQIDELVAIATPLLEEQMNAETKAALQAALDGVGNDEPMNVISTLNEIIPVAQSSVNAYKPLYNALVNAKEKAESAQASPAVTATFYEVYDRIEKGYNEGDYVNEEISALIEELSAALNEYLTSEITGSDENPTDLSYLIVNANMTEGNTGWVGAGTVGTEYSIMEHWNANFETYQVLKGLPNGTYKVTVQGYYRAGNPEPAAEARLAGNEPLNAILSANEYSVPLMSIYEYPSVEYPLCGTPDDANAWPYDSYEEAYGYIPNSLEGARAYFNEGKYLENELFVNVSDGTLVIKISKTTLIDYDWAAFTDFTLTYYGENSVNSIEDSLADNDKHVKVQYYNVNGVQQNGLVKGVNIVRKTFRDGTVKVFKVSK